MPTVLIILAILLAIVGVSQINQATLGVGVMAFACLCGILARIAQAKAQHDAEMKAIAAIGQAQQPTHSANPEPERAGSL